MEPSRHGRFTLVLGAGGTVGMAYHSGVLRALHRLAGIDPAAAEVIVGTSAGSVIGSYLRSGFSTDDMWEFARGTHPRIVDAGPQQRSIFVPSWHNPFELWRVGVGSAYVMARSLWRGPGLPVPRALSRQFPAGLFSTADFEEWLGEDVGTEWPDRPLWLCTVDISSGRRVVLGRSTRVSAPLPRAVMASCSIPGFFRPVRVGALTLVDGGAHSTTNLDLAAATKADVVIGIAPMAYDPAHAPSGLARMARGGALRSLSTEMALARRKGRKVVLIRPTSAELRIHGRNMLSASAGAEIAQSAYDATARLLETPLFTEALGPLIGVAAAG